MTIKLHLQEYQQQWVLRGQEMIRLEQLADDPLSSRVG